MKNIPVICFLLVFFLLCIETSIPFEAGPQFALWISFVQRMAISPKTFEGDQRFAEKTLSQMEGNVYIYYIDRAGTVVVLFLLPDS